MGPELTYSRAWWSRTTSSTSWMTLPGCGVGQVSQSHQVSRPLTSSLLSPLHWRPWQVHAHVRWRLNPATRPSSDRLLTLSQRSGWLGIHPFGRALGSSARWARCRHGTPCRRSNSSEPAESVNPVVARRYKTFAKLPAGPWRTCFQHREYHALSGTLVSRTSLDVIPLFYKAEL